MAILPLTRGFNNPILRKESKKVTKIDRKIKKLVADMTNTMIDCDGLGIAAPQVGINLRIYIARLNFNTPNEVNVPMINTEFLEMSDEKIAREEGCLSLPRRFGTVMRSRKVMIQYMDLHGKTRMLRLEGLNARIMQHEMDHLNGTLIADKFEKEVDAEMMGAETNMDASASTGGSMGAKHKDGI